MQKPKRMTAIGALLSLSLLTACVSHGQRAPEVIGFDRVPISGPYHALRGHAGGHVVYETITVDTVHAPTKYSAHHHHPHH